jgi:hypothetical protein
LANALIASEENKSLKALRSGITLFKRRELGD